MKKLLKAAALAAGLLGISFGGAAQADGTSPAFPFAATGFVGGGGAFLDTGSPLIGDREIGVIVAGGDMVIPVTGYWNIQLGGAFRVNHEHIFFFLNDTMTQFQGGGIGFWRDPSQGAFGIEAGLFTGDASFETYAKLGGVAEYYFGETATFNIFGGALVPLEPGFFGPQVSIETGFYTGGHITWYASSNLALAAFGNYMQQNFDNFIGDTDLNSLTVGGKVRYLTSMPGVELFASGSFNSCWADTTGGPLLSAVNDGVEVMAGINIRLGGRNGSLVDIDRSNAFDTRAWECLPVVVPQLG